MYSFQRNFIYFPDTRAPNLPDDAEIARVETSDGVNLSGWYFPARSNKSPVIVFFHGNAGTLDGSRLFKARSLVQEGYGVLLAEYRGYGGNSGKPSEAGLYADARAYIDYLLTQVGHSEADLVLYGESLGSGVATQMATEYQVMALILEAPFDSLLSLASRNYFYLPVRFLLKDRYMSIEKISDIDAPLLILHGHKDEVIPFRAAKNLFDAAKTPKKFVDFPQGKHSDLYNFGANDHIVNFLSGNTHKNPDNEN